jgi:hypothetical protein
VHSLLEKKKTPEKGDVICTEALQRERERVGRVSAHSYKSHAKREVAIMSCIVFGVRQMNHEEDRIQANGSNEEKLDSRCQNVDGDRAEARSYYIL